MPSKIENHLIDLLKIKGEHEGRKISLSQTSRETGIRLASLSAWKNQQVTQFSASVVIALCEYLGCGVGELLVYVKGEAGVTGQNSGGEY